WSATKAFLRPVLSRPNLHVLTHTHVERIDVERRDGMLRAVGVTAVTGDGRRARADDASGAQARERIGSPHGERRRISARREVILAAGAIGSPQILQLSGIGPRTLLDAHGIDVVRDLPGVGE